MVLDKLVLCQSILDKGVDIWPWLSGQETWQSLRLASFSYTFSRIVGLWERFPSKIELNDDLDLSHA